MADYEFKYAPLTGRLTGNQMIEQTEQAINGLAKLVDEAAGQVTIISTLANEANENAANALEVAEEALSTTGRTYITVSTQTDADNYYDSELIYMADSTSTNIPVADTGMLEAKTNDTKTACEQVFIADSSGEAYYRNGSITAETVGDVTTYTVSWGAWSSEPASRDYVQSELTNYLPLSGGTITGNLDTTGDLDIGGDSSVTGDLDVTGAITGNSVTSNSVNVKSGSVAPVNTLQRSTAYSVDDIVYTSALNAKYYLLCVTAGTTSATMPSFSGAGSNTEVTDGTVVWRVQTITSQEKAAGFPIGFEYFQTNPNVPAGSLPMLGGVYSRETYADLWDWVQTQTGYLITDSAWVTLSNTQNGNVPFYSSGDGSTTFRVPSLKCWIKGTDGVETVGTYKDAGLPNITGKAVTVGVQDITTAGSDGALSQTAPQYYSSLGSGSYHWSNHDIRLDASASNSIYGNADTVVPESIIGVWLVKAYGTVVDTGTIDEKAYMDEQFAINVPTGCVQAFAGNTTPQGWLLCDGSAVSRTQYSRLFGVIGTTYGAGDGTDTFNVPNLVDKFIQGNATSGTEHSAGLPDITGGFGSQRISMGGQTPYGNGAFRNYYAEQNATGAVGSNGWFTVDFYASRSSAIYGNSTTVQPPSLTMRYIIKY